MALDGEFFFDDTGGATGAGTWADPYSTMTHGISQISFGDILTFKPDATTLTGDNDMDVSGMVIRSGYRGVSDNVSQQALIVPGSITAYIFNLQNNASLQNWKIDLGANAKDAIRFAGSNQEIKNIWVIGSNGNALYLTSPPDSYIIDGCMFERPFNTNSGAPATGKCLVRNTAFHSITGDWVLNGLIENVSVRSGAITIDAPSASDGDFLIIDGLFSAGNITIASGVKGIGINIKSNGTITNNSSDFELVESSGISKLDVANALKDTDVSGTGSVGGSVVDTLSTSGISKLDVANALKDTDVSGTGAIDGSVVDTLTTTGVTRSNSRLKELSYDTNGNPVSYEEHFYPTATDAADDTNVSKKLLVQTTYGDDNEITGRLIKDIT